MSATENERRRRTDLPPLSKQARKLDAIIRKEHGNAQFDRTIYSAQKYMDELLEHGYLRHNGDGKVFHCGWLIFD